MLEYKQKRNNGRTPFAGVYKLCVCVCVFIFLVRFTISQMAYYSDKLSIEYPPSNGSNCSDISDNFWLRGWRKTAPRATLTISGMYLANSAPSQSISDFILLLLDSHSVHVVNSQSLRSCQSLGVACSRSRRADGLMSGMTERGPTSLCPLR